MSYLIFLLVIPIALAILTRFRSHQLTWQFFSNPSAYTPNKFQPISILVPVRGIDQNAENNYQSYIDQDYPAPFEVIFALEEESDPAVPVINKLIHNNPDAAIRIIFSDNVQGIGKIKNQIAASHQCQYDLWVLVDSDVELKSNFLKTQAASLSDKDNIGLAFAAPVAVGSQDWVAALHNIAVTNSLLFYCQVAEENKTTAGPGSCMITKRSVINKIGGLESIASNVVGLDISLCQAITDAGYKIQQLREIVFITHQRDQFIRYWWQTHRWLATINKYTPGFWLIAIIFGLPIVWSLVFLTLSFCIGKYQVIGVCLVLASLISEWVSITTINLKLTRDKDLWRYIWIAPLGQLLSVPLLILSISSEKVRWRGRWLELKPS